jgi:hypothetical protein
MNKNWIAMVLMLLSVQVLAAEKTPEELCRERNASSCEINGLKFFLTEQECPQGAKILRHLGHEDCSRFKLAMEASPPLHTADNKASKESVKDFPAAADKEQGEVIFWSNPYFVLALIGLLQGMISRFSIGSMVIVMLVMPLIGTWSMVSGVHMVGGLSANMAYIGMELLGTFLFSMAGWAAGAAIRWVAYKLLLG